METSSVISELYKSITYIENSLKTSISYEGNATNLLIDELQFLFNPACIIIQVPQGIYANISLIEQDYILSHIKKIEGSVISKFIEETNFEIVDYSQFSFKDSSLQPLRNALKQSTRLISISTHSNSGDWKIYFCLDSSRRYFPFWDNDDFFRYLLKIMNAVFINFKSNGYQSQLPDRLKHGFNVSPYLEIVFEALAKRITSHLSVSNNHFEKFVLNPFFLQFFLLHDSDGENKEQGIRFYPLERQKKILRNEEMQIRIMNKLQHLGPQVPKDPFNFITEYVWKADRSFAGYVYQSGCSLYIYNWESEPFIRATHLEQDEQNERRIVTEIMQTLRDDTPHLFIIPLYAGKQTIGVVLLNCPEDVPETSRIDPIRSARSVGFPIVLALETDEIVNHIQEEKRKAAQVRSYLHVTQSLLHSEGSYCMELEAFLETLQENEITNPQIITPFLKRISYSIRDKYSLIKEFSSTQNPIREIPLELIYPKERGIEASIQINHISEMLKILYELFCREGNLQLKISFGHQLNEMGEIINFDYYILARVLSNLIRNSNRTAVERSIKNAWLNLNFEIVQHINQQSLQIIATDNCGGFSPEILEKTKGDITFDTWSNYLNEGNDEKKVSRGMGFLMLAKYTSATGGLCHIKNTSGIELGAYIDIVLGLKIN